MTSIRTVVRDTTGVVRDGGVTFDLEQFAGHVPHIGDLVLDPGVPEGSPQHDPRHRTIWSVVGRVFNPCDQEEAIALIVETRQADLGDEAFACNGSSRRRG